jgi:hypothetical protein
MQQRRVSNFLAIQEIAGERPNTVFSDGTALKFCKIFQVIFGPILMLLS